MVQTVHIIAIAILLTAVYVLSFRLIGLTRGQPLATLTARSTPWIWAALCVLLLTGALLTITEPARELLNWAFRAKMLLVAGLAVILRLLQLSLRRNPQYWSSSTARRRCARAVGTLCIVVGASIVTAGRWIAYV